MKQQELKKYILQEVSQVGSPLTKYNAQVILSLGQHMQEYIAEYGEDRQKIQNIWKDIASLDTEQGGIYGKLLAEFEWLELLKDGALTDVFLRQVLEDTSLGWRNQLYMLRQTQSLLFTGTVQAGEDTGVISWKIYDECYTDFLGELEGDFVWISSEEREDNLVLVTTSQLLSLQHAPTKTALDRCAVLLRKGKNVLLINTGEQGAEIGNILLFRRMNTNYRKKLCEKTSLSYEGLEIPFYQCSRHMPNVAETRELLQLVAQKRPAYVIDIGGSSLVADVMSNMVPVLTVATVFSGLAVTHTQFQMIGRSLTENDLTVLCSRGKAADHVISGRFTFSLKPQSQNLSRKLLGIPEDAFAAAVVGARLEREVTDEFLEILLETGVFLVFVGELDYQSRLKHFPQLAAGSVYLESRSDVLAVLEQTDIYINPPRNGGGSSVVEAMYKGVVPVTLPQGDVYVNTGNDFAVRDYGQMKEEIRHLWEDASYYDEQSQKAREKATVLMDSDAAFGQVLDEFERREREREKSLRCATVPHYTVDILIAVAEKGGVENLIKMMTETLECEEIHFRVVQMVWEGYRWLAAGVEFCPLLKGRAGHHLQEFVDAYAHFLQTSDRIPDVILVAGWPYLCTVARAVSTSFGREIPVVSWLHAPVKNYERAGFGGMAQLSDADVHFAISEEIAKELRASFGEKKVCRVYNPVVFPEKSEAIAVANAARDEKQLSHQLLFVGRLDKEKNIGYLLQSMARQKQWTLHLVGDGPERHHLELVVRKLQIEDRVVWYGWQEKPWDCVAKVDALVMASFYEGFSLTVVEALGRGIPTITTRVGVALELIHQGKNGYLYDLQEGALCHILRQIENQGYVVQDDSLCRESTKRYEKEAALEDMKQKILQCIESKGADERKEKKGMEHRFSDTDAILEGSRLMEENKWQQALEVVYQGLQVNPCNHELYFMLGQIKEVQGNFKQAQFSYENAIYYSTKEDYEPLLVYYEQFCQGIDFKRGKVSIVILTYNQLDYTKLCIESIRKTTPDNTYEIIIVDNMSTDGTREWLQKQTDIRYILNDENKGFPAGCNQGAALADEENDIFLLNNDTIVMTNSIYNLRMALHEEERTGAVGAVTNFAGANQMISEKFSTIEEYVEYAGKNNAYSPVRHDKRLCLIGFAMMVKGEVWRKVDGFDERYGKGNFEDDDLGLKILTHDYYMRLCKDSFIYHFGSVSFREASKKEPDSYRGLLGKNRDQFNEKWNIKWGYFSHVRNELIDLIQEPKDKKFSVLEVGCASGATLVEIENRYLHAVTYGFELNKTVAQIASHYVNVLPGDVEEKVNYFNVTYDYIILGNVLEHIHNPEDILKTLKTWLKPEGRFIISLPNIMHISVVMPLLRGRFEYKGEGVLDRTHLRFFTKTEIILLMEQCSLQIDRMGASMLELSKEQERYITRLCEMDGAIPKEELSAYQYWIVARSKGE